MLDETTLNNYKSELDEIHQKINELANHEVEILKEIRKQLLEIIVENKQLIEDLWEQKYDEEEIGLVQNSTQFDIDVKKTAIYNFNANELRWNEWSKTIINTIKDNQAFKAKVSKKNNQ